jgi:hypothetical protein
MIEEKLARVLKLKQQRDQIDAELRSIFGMAEAPKRGRPRKELNSGSTVSEGSSETHSTSESDWPPSPESESN